MMTVNESIRACELQLKAWEFLTIEEEREIIAEIVRLKALDCEDDVR